jgi:hypothetical protein
MILSLQLKVYSNPLKLCDMLYIRKAFLSENVQTVWLC